MNVVPNLDRTSRTRTYWSWCGFDQVPDLDLWSVFRFWSKVAEAEPDRTAASLDGMEPALNIMADVRAYFQGK